MSIPKDAPFFISLSLVLATFLPSSSFEGNFTARARVPASVPQVVEGLYRQHIIAPYTPPETKEGIPVAFLDADSTLRVTKSGSYFPVSKDDVTILPGVADKIIQLNNQGYFIAVVSNQNAPIEVSDQIADGALVTTATDLKKIGATVNYFDYGSEYRGDEKPTSAMADRLEKLLQAQFGPSTHIDRAHSFMVGDAAYSAADLRPNGQVGTDFADSDRKFAENIGVRFIEPDVMFGWADHGVHRFEKLQEVLDYKKKLGIVLSPLEKCLESQFLMMKGN